MKENEVKEAIGAATGKLPRGRKVVDLGNLRQTVEQQKKLDADKPPDGRAALIDIVRQFGPLIQARRNAKWTDAEICAWLVELGYVIDPATLRAYRSKLGILSPAVEGADTQTVAAVQISDTSTKSVKSRQPTTPPNSLEQSLAQAGEAAEGPAPPQAARTDDADGQDKEFTHPRRGPKPSLNLDDGV